MGDFVNIFELQKLFVGYFSGTPIIFSAIFMLLLAFFSAKYGLTLRMFLLVATVSSVIMATYLGVIPIVFILLLAFTIFKVIGKLPQ